MDLGSKNHFNSEQKLFPNVINGKINTLEFLEACRGVSILIDKFGKAYAPMSYDLNGNIDKLQKTYNASPKTSVTLEDMLQQEVNVGKNYAIDALMWLRRGLHFFLIFLERIVQFKDEDALGSHMEVAYKNTLEPYHGWVTKKLFYVIKKMVASRSSLLLAVSYQQPVVEEELMKSIEQFNNSLSVNIVHLQQLYTQNGWEVATKAP